MLLYSMRVVGRVCIQFPADSRAHARCNGLQELYIQYATTTGIDPVSHNNVDIIVEVRQKNGLTLIYIMSNIMLRSSTLKSRKYYLPVDW